jgi:hypothetical protein
MLYQEEKILIYKFLSRNYPVLRIKHNMRFKRAISVYNQYYFLGDKNNSNELYYQLLDILKIVFNTPDDINKDILKTFLHL